MLKLYFILIRRIKQSVVLIYKKWVNNLFFNNSKNNIRIFANVEMNICKIFTAVNFIKQEKETQKLYRPAKPQFNHFLLVRFSFREHSLYSKYLNI